MTRRPERSKSNPSISTADPHGDEHRGDARHCVETVASPSVREELAFRIAERDLLDVEQGKIGMEQIPKIVRPEGKRDFLTIDPKGSLPARTKSSGMDIGDQDSPARP